MCLHLVPMLVAFLVKGFPHMSTCLQAPPSGQGLSLESTLTRSCEMS